MTKKRNRRTKHHLVPRSKGGGDDPGNIMMMDEKLHHAWHVLFGNQTIGQIIRMLLGIYYAKGKTTFYRRRK